MVIGSLRTVADFDLLDMDFVDRVGIHRAEEARNRCKMAVVYHSRVVAAHREIAVVDMVIGFDKELGLEDRLAVDHKLELEVRRSLSLAGVANHRIGTGTDCMDQT